MITSRIAQQIAHPHERGLVFSAGGSSDIILAKTIAAGLVREGCSQIDLAQPLNCHALSDKGLLSKTGERYALETEGALDPEFILRHRSSVPVERYPARRRGKGLSISSSLEWEHGARYVFAARGRGPSALAERRDGDASYYDFAVGVDGGGDVLTHDADEFDRVVLDGVRSGWTTGRPLLLVVMGLGADGGSAPSEFDNVSLAGWRELESTSVDNDFCDSLQHELVRLGLWHPTPSSWNADDPYWGYGLKVPQIIALAARGEFPFNAPGHPLDAVDFPRRGQLKRMDRRRLCEVRLFMSEGE